MHCTDLWSLLVTVCNVYIQIVLWCFNNISVTIYVVEMNEWGVGYTAV